MTSTLGERIRIHRRRRGLARARLAHLVGRSERWLLDVERGEVDPRFSDALALAEALGLRLDDLAGPVGGDRAGRARPLARG